MESTLGVAEIEHLWYHFELDRQIRRKVADLAIRHERLVDY